MAQGTGHPHAEWIRTIVNAQHAHILVIPGAFSNTYLAADPKKPTATYDEEARIATRLIQKFRKTIGEDKISDVQFVGLSYGSFIAPLVAKLGVPNLSKMTLLSPPYSMKAIISALDRTIDENLKDYPWDYTIGSAVLWAKAGVSSEPVARLRESKRYLAWSFQYGQILNALDLGMRFGCDWPAMKVALASSPQIGSLPINEENFARESLAFRKFGEEVRFWNTIEHCTPQNLPFYKSARDYNPNQLKALNSLDIDIVLAQDDTLIESSEWRKAMEILPSVRYIELPYGGHTGYIYTNWLRYYLNDRIQN